jgi:hypothetical protein
VGLVGEGLDDAHAADVLLQPGVEGADAAELGLPVAGQPAAVARHHEARQRHGEEGDQRQRHVDGEHQGEGAEEGHHRDEQVLRPVVGDLADLLQVLRHAGDEVAGLLLVVEAEREGLEVVEGAAAHLRLDVDAEHVPPVGHDRHQPGVERVDREQAGGGQQDQRPVPAGQEHVDEGLHGHREPELEQAGEHGAAEVEQEQPAVRPVVGEEGSEHDGDGKAGGALRSARGRD